MKFSPIQWAYVVGFWLGGIQSITWATFGPLWGIAVGFVMVAVSLPVQYRLHKSARSLYGRGSRS
jgi:hypothetical protein